MLMMIMLSSSSSRMILRLRLVRCVVWMVDGHAHHVQCSGFRMLITSNVLVAEDGEDED